MESEFWIKKWQTGDTRFHQVTFHPELVKFGDKLTAKTVLVPLCGKSLDMLYFVSRGQAVIGVELSELACEGFFQENNIVYEKQKVSEFVVYKSAHVTLWCGDFFKLPASVWAQVGAIYDRAALVALPPEMRQRYTREIVQRASAKMQVLLVAYEYPQDSMQGPPFSVGLDEIRLSYTGFTLHTLATRSEELRTTTATESVYWMERIE